MSSHSSSFTVLPVSRNDFVFFPRGIDAELLLFKLPYLNLAIFSLNREL